MNLAHTIWVLALAIILAFSTSPLSAAGYSKAEITRLHKDVKILKENVAPKTAAVGQEINPVTSVATGADSRAELRFPDKSLTRLGANSRFTLRGDSRTLDLEKGTMLLQVPEQIRGAKVRTAAVTAAVTGGTALMEYLPGGYIKLIVIEGFVDVFMNSDPSKFKTFNAGQMLIMKTDGTFIPEGVDVDLKTLLKTSKLLSNNDDSSINKNLVNDAVSQQQQQIQDGELTPTNLIIPGQGTTVVIDTSQRTNLLNNFGIRDGTPPPAGTTQQQINSNPLNLNPTQVQQVIASFQGFAPLIAGKTVFNETSTVFSNPHVTAFNVKDGTVVTSEGIIYNGNDQGLLQFHAFGNSSVVKPTLQEKVNAKGDWALFRFEDLFINGTPLWEFFPAGGFIGLSGGGPGTESEVDLPIKNIILASNNGIRIGGIDLYSPENIPSGAGGSNEGGVEGEATLDLYDFHTENLESLILISNNGDITLRADSTGFAISGYNQDVSIIAAGLNSDVNIEGGIALSSGVGGAGSVLDVIAGRDVNITSVNVVSGDIGINSGRDVNISDGVVRANGKNLIVKSGRHININNTSVLKALLAAPDTLLRLEAGQDINLATTDLESGGIIELQSNLGNITLNQVTSSSDVFKATTLSPNGWITIGNSTISAKTLIDLYAAGAHGGIKFVENSTLDSPTVNLHGHTVQIINGKVVNIPQGVLNINATNHQYNRTDVPGTTVPGSGHFNVGGGSPD